MDGQRQTAAFSTSLGEYKPPVSVSRNQIKKKHWHGWLRGKPEGRLASPPQTSNLIAFFIKKNLTGCIWVQTDFHLKVSSVFVIVLYLTQKNKPVRLLFVIKTSLGVFIRKLGGSVHTQPLLQRKIEDNTRGKVPKCLYSGAAPAVSTVLRCWHLDLALFFF